MHENLVSIWKNFIRQNVEYIIIISLIEDCNGVLNILKKSKVVDLKVVLYNRGELNTPKRIRIVVVLSNFLENF